MIQDLLIPRRQEIEPTRVPYSDDVLRTNLLRLENAWEEFQSTRDRAAVYLYLTPVFELVAVWEALGQLREITCRALRFRGGNLRLAADPIAAVIFLTSDPKKVDRRSRSKWSRVLRYAGQFKHQAEPLQDFIQRKGGINECAALDAQCLGLHSKKGPLNDARRVTLADHIRAERKKDGRLSR